MECCHGGKGPGYATPLDAINGPHEKLLYVPCVVPDSRRPDYLATIDADVDSPTYSKVIHRTHFLHLGDEPHHSGWNSCSSCFGDPSAPPRSVLVLPCLGAPRVYGVDVGTDPRAPKIAKVVEPEEVSKHGLSYLHTTHCLGSGDIMVSAMGDGGDGASGGFLLIGQDFKVKGTWGEERTKYGYDFWYQPRLNVMVSSGWGSPDAFSRGFDPSLVPTKYNDALYFWDWQQRHMFQEVHLGGDGLIPLEVRFLHSPDAPHGFCGAALSSNVIHFTKDPADHHKWATSVAIRQPWAVVQGWVLPELPPLITDILLSLDDRYLFFSNWLRGDVCQYDIGDPAHPRFVSRVWLGGVVRRGKSVQASAGMPEGTPPEGPDVPDVKGKRLEGGPQMLQLSLDGKRLYVTNSLYSPWDKQFYPDLAKNGSYLLQVDVDGQNGMVLNPGFLVDFGAEPDGPVLAHEVRYPGGDCSSDIWV